MATLPLPLELTVPVPGTVIPEEQFDEIRREWQEAYNPVTQVNETEDGTPYIFACGTKCDGICGTPIGGVIVSERDTVNDD